MFIFKLNRWKIVLLFFSKNVIKYLKQNTIVQFNTATTLIIETQKLKKLSSLENYCQVVKQFYNGREWGGMGWGAKIPKSLKVALKSSQNKSQILEI